jgi:hypothetical protein
MPSNRTGYCRRFSGGLGLMAIARSGALPAPASHELPNSGQLHAEPSDINELGDDTSC